MIRKPMLPNGTERWQVHRLDSLEATLYAAPGSSDQALDLAALFADGDFAKSLAPDDSGQQADVFFIDGYAVKAGRGADVEVPLREMDVVANIGLHVGLKKAAKHKRQDQLALDAPEIYAAVIPDDVRGMSSVVTYVMEQMIGEVPAAREKVLSDIELQIRPAAALKSCGLNLDRIAIDSHEDNLLVERDLASRAIKRAHIFDVRTY